MIGRRDWVQADLRCLMCGRVTGRLVGPAPANEAERRALRGRPPRFAAFLPPFFAAPASGAFTPMVAFQFSQSRLAMLSVIGEPSVAPHRTPETMWT